MASISLQKTRDIEKYEENPKLDQTSPTRDLKVLYRTITIETKQQNVTVYDPRLAEFLHPSDHFYVHDMTLELQEFVQSSGITDGNMTVQILHTSATLCVNELDEPMLLMDIVQKMREFAPKEASYFHNGPMRTINLCADDYHCDRNADAHLRTALFGHTSISLIVRNGNLVLGKWQKVALLEFDGPRPREVLVQAMGI